jgi:diguanylate cyclase (GGDEF)-like protein
MDISPRYKFLLYAIFALDAAVFSYIYITRPFIKVKVAMTKVAQGDMTTRLFFKSSDEVGMLSTSFNMILDEFLRREKDIAYRNTLLYNLSLVSEKLSAEINKSKIYREILNAASWGVEGTDVFIWVEDEGKFLDERKVDDTVKSMTRGGASEREENGMHYLAFSMRADGGIYGKLIARKRTYIIPVEREFLYSISQIASSLLQRADFVKRLEYLSVTDPLTGVYNRRFFIETLTNEFLKMKRLSGEFSVILLDIDSFKTINDTYGHVIGDEVLKAFAYIMRKSVRGYDVVARYGGDEFTILLVQTPKDKAQIVAWRVLRAFSKAETLPSFIDRENLSISCGICQFSEADSVDDILRISDRRMYKAKADRIGVCLED